jgi:hypothetical protein
MGLGSIIKSGIDGFWSLVSYMRATKTIRQVSPDVRATTFAVNEQLYDNTIYEPACVGGMSEWLLKNYFGITKEVPGFAGYFNPVKEVVDAYQNVLPGQWGQDLRPVAIEQGQDIDPQLLAALSLIWRDSNLDSEKQMLQRWAANLGTVGLRVVTYRKSGRVAVKIDHPGRLFDVEEDAEGNVVAVTLKYTLPINVGTGMDPIYEQQEVVEEITRDSLSQTIDGVQQIPDDDRTNSFGFCPYVILRHRDNGTIFGDWAYKGAERLIHRINYRIARHDVAVDRNLFPRWWGTAGGKKPEVLDLGGEKFTYVQNVAGMPPATLEALVARLQHGEIMAFWKELRDMLRGPLPELTLNDVKLLSNISGDALQRVLAPAKAAIEAVRPNYDHALIRAMQMAVSIGMDTGAVQMGGGGDAAYHAGKLNFRLADRPALPQTLQDRLDQVKVDDAKKLSKLTVAKMAQSLGVDKKQVLIEAGYSEKEADDILKRKSETDVTQDNQL